MIYELFSPAKINLFLEVTGKRPDGYHELLTLFAKLNFGDKISLQIEDSETTAVELTAAGPHASALPPKEKNLVYRAVISFFDAFNIKAKCNIALEKNIPAGAGLGGGSSNAGTTLKCLAAHYKKDIKDVLPLAAKMGADIPLFLYDDAFMLGRGIGDKLIPVKAKNPQAYILVAWPGVHVATKDVFAALKPPAQKELLTTGPKLDKILYGLKKGSGLDAWGTGLFNRLERVVLAKSKETAGLKELFKTSGCKYAMMSGSGSSVFGLFEHTAARDEAALKLERAGIAAFKTDFVRCL